jgi:transcription initiation factor TFIIIB Brf1 subunit/transcription initiation factor TFIIB
MACSNCGSAVADGSVVCQSCGTAVSQETAQNHSQSSGQQRSADQAGQPSRSGRQPRPPDEGWSRRDLLKYGGGGVAGLGILVWLFGGGGPAAVVKKYFAALGRGDMETAKRMAGDDEPMLPGLFIVGTYSDSTVSVDRTTVRKNTGSEATVRTTLTVASTTSAESTTSELDVALTTEGGQWKISSVSDASGE